MSSEASATSGTTPAPTTHSPAKHQRSIYRVVGQTYRKHALLLTFGMIALVIGQAGALLIPKLTGLGVDSIKQLGNLTARDSTDFFSQATKWLAGIASGMEPSERFNRVLILLAAASVAVAFFQFVKRRAITGLSRQIEFDMKEKLYAHIQVMPMDQFARIRSGDLLSRATSDVESVRMMFGPAVMYLGEVIVLLPIALVAMFMTSTYLAWWSLLPLLLLTLSTLYFSPRTRKYSLMTQERQADLSARAQENFSGTRVVKAFGREDFESDAFDEIGEQLLDSQLAQARARQAYQASIWTLNGGATLVFLFFGAREIAHGNLSLGQFLEFNLYFFALFWPMIAFGWVILLIVRGRVSARRINEIFDIEPDPSTQPGGESAHAITGKIEFRDVSFEYEAGKPVLKNISFTVDAGHTLAIVGPVGCGKSTIARLLLRLREATSGEILVDDVRVQDYDASELRKRIGFVPQETFLFSESIGENIAFGLEGNPADDVQEASEIAQLHAEVMPLPEGYDTLLGERGVNLSGGQKQRAAIARALVKKPAIVVLDDALSAVDTKTEEAILDGLKRVLKTSTNMIIAQRVSTVSHAEEVIVLDRGQIVQRGSDADLRTQPGLYAEMAARQNLEASLAGQ